MIRLGIVGVGYWGPNIVRSVENAGAAEIAWLCDKNPATCASLQSRYPNLRITAEAGQIFDDACIDAVIIATPTATHHALARRALEAGKHVLVEKPITTSAEDARDLIATADRLKRILMVGHVFEYNASIRKLRELIADGELGDIHYLSFERTNLGPVRVDVNAMWDLATHDVSIMCHLLGKSPVAVSATGYSYLNAGIEDVAFATFRFADGIAAHVHASWLNPRKIRQITVVGSRRMAVWDDLDIVSPIRLYNKRVHSPTSVSGEFLDHKTVVFDDGVISVPVTANEPLLAEIRHFFDCVREQRVPISDGRNGLRVVKGLEAATASSRAGGTTIAIPDE